MNRLRNQMFSPLFASAGRSSSSGLRGLISQAAHVWFTERTTDAQVRLLASRTRLVEAEATALEAEFDARSRVLTAERRYQTVAQPMPMASAAWEHLIPLTRQVLERQDAIEQRLARYEQHQTTALPRSNVPALPPGPRGSLDVALTDREIERLAGKAVRQFSLLPAAEQEAAWRSWRGEIRQRFPGLAAEEICRKAEELGQLFR